MEREQVVQRVRSSGLIAILRHTDSGLANDTASALLDGGVDVVEVTLNTRGALEMVGAISRHFGERLVVGAGTVMSAEAADQAIAVGARLIVCPHFDESIVRRAVERGVAVIPGGFTPTEIVRAWDAGASFVKVFPAGSVGPRYIRDLLAPLNHIPLVPTGGVSLDNAADFIRAGAAALGLGGALVDPKLVAAGRFDDLTRTAQAFVAAVQTGREKPA